MKRFTLYFVSGDDPTSITAAKIEESDDWLLLVDEEGATIAKFRLRALAGWEIEQ